MQITQKQSYPDSHQSLSIGNVLPQPNPVVPDDQHWDCFHDLTDLKAGRWGREFMPGHHIDSRQPSSLTGLMADPATR
jgi:hypothetical protein